MSYNHTHTALGNALSKCGPSTGHAVVPVAYCDSAATSHALASLIRLASRAYEKPRSAMTASHLTELRDVLEALGIDTDALLKRTAS